MTAYRGAKMLEATVEPGIHMTWLERGTGSKNIVFVHGLAGFAALWQHQMDALSVGAHCYAVDLPGNGHAKAGDYPYTMFFYAESLARWVEKIIEGPVTLCGHSMGGQISVLMALRYPSLVEKLVLLAPAGFETFSAQEVMMMDHMMQMGNQGYMNLAHVDQTIYQSFYQSNPEAKSIIEEIRHIHKRQPGGKWAEMIRLSVKGMLSEPVFEYLQLLNIPVEVIFGEKDAFIPNRWLHPMESTRSIAVKAISRIPQGSLHLIADAGHFVHLEKSKEVNGLMLDFI